MGYLKKHPPVKLIVGFIFKQGAMLEKAKFILQKSFGQIDFESKTLNFTHTDYYQKEFGKDLKRVFISFKRLISADSLPKIKISTNNIEKKLSARNCRQINIDAGYLDLAKLILATTKDYRHRIYLSRGVYAEATIFYQDKTFKSWDWTYPDYRSAEYIEIFNRIRQIYAEQIKNI